MIWLLETMVNKYETIMFMVLAWISSKQHADEITMYMDLLSGLLMMDPLERTTIVRLQYFRLHFSVAWLHGLIIVIHFEHVN